MVPPGDPPSSWPPPTTEPLPPPPTPAVDDASDDADDDADEGGRIARAGRAVAGGVARGRDRVRRRRLSRNPPPPPTDDEPAISGSLALARWDDAAPLHLTLDDLPAEVADELRFDTAAPRALRGAKLPPEVRATFRYVWNGVIADVYDELRGEPRTGHLRRSTVARILERIGLRLQQSQVALIVAGVYYPFPGTRSGMATAGLASAGLAGTEEVIAYSSAGTAAAGAVGAAVMGELLEVYVAASARTRQYRDVGRAPSPERIVEDLAEVYGSKGRTARRTSIESVQWAIRRLAAQMLPRTGSRFFKALIPGVGIVLSGALSARDLRRVLAVPLAPVDVEEADRLRAEALGEEESYEHTVQRLLELFAAGDGEAPAGTPEALER